MLQALEPHLIGGLFGRPDTLSARLAKHHGLSPRTLFFAILLAATTVLLILAELDGALWTSQGRSGAVAMLVHLPRHLRGVALPLLQDPVGIVVVVAGLATPRFCAIQVEAIADFVPMNERNLGPAFTSQLDLVAVNDLVALANRRYSRVGTWWASCLTLFGASGISVALYLSLARRGLMASWNPTTQSATVWRSHVYAGWWANFDSHPDLAIVLILLGCYMFYFLSKQLCMGAIFALFARAAAKREFGVTPNLDFDSDGYYGLRPLRRFMLRTYLSSLSHFVVTIGFFVVWLPVGPATLFMTILVMLINAGVVIFPSIVAYDSAMAAKAGYAERIFADPALDRDTKRKAIADVWVTPSLPFRTRSSLTAVTLYLLVPLVLAIVSAVLKVG